MRVRVMGGVVVVHADGHAASITSPRPRLILAMLASRYGTVVSEDALVDAIWGDERPASVRTALQTYVSALRDELEPDRPRRSPGRFILRDTDGYALRSRGSELDIAVFEESIRAAREQHLDDRAGAIERLERALEIWRDPPFGEFADMAWALGATTRLRELHASALEARFGLALDAGDEAAALVRMEAGVQRYPYRERLAGQRMLALYRRGEQEQALAQYETTRRRLVEDLGLDPGRELQLIERAILAQDPVLRTRGPGPAERSTVRVTDVPRAKPLVGRDDELRDVVNLVRTERCVSIVGPGGVGKSSLATNVVDQVTSRFEDRIYHLDLAELAGRDVLRSLAAAVRVVEHPLAPLADCVADAIGDQPTLLVVETCEVAIEAAGSALSSVLSAPGLSVLLTSQMPLHIQTERVFRLAALGSDAAVALLTRSRVVADSDLPALTAIGDCVSRLPLGLELAAGWLDTLGPQELLRGLQAGSDLLVGASDRPERQRSLQSAVQWSLGLLGNEERRVLEQLAAFSAPFSVDAARALLGDTKRLGPVVGELTDRSLLERVAGSPTRFRLPDIVRAVVLDAADIESVEAARTQLAEICLEAAQARMFGQTPSVDLDQFHGEVVPALTRFHELGDARQLGLAGLLGTFFIEQARIGEGRDQLDKALQAHTDTPEVIRLLTVVQLGFLAWYQGDLVATRRILSDVVELLDHAPSPGFESAVSGCLAFAEHRFEDAAELLSAATDSLAGETKQEMMLLHIAGNACWYAGDRAGAVTRYRGQRDLGRARGDDFYIAQALRFEAMVAAQMGDIEPAWRWAERSLAMARVMADSLSLAQASAASAVVASLAGVETDATRHAVDAVRVSRSHFDVFALRTAIPIVADAGLRNGDSATAARLVGWYLDLLDRTGQTASPATAHLNCLVGRVRDALGVPDFARVSAQGAAGQLSDVIADAASVQKLRS